MPKARDPDFEALEQATHANREIERGRLNTALKAIKVAWQKEGGRPEDLAEEIPRRAEAYHRLWPEMALTPTALAVHWSRVTAENARIAKAKTPQAQAMDELRKESER